jgi:hypothetical protein
MYYLKLQYYHRFLHPRLYFSLVVDAALQFLVKRLSNHGALSKTNIIEAIQEYEKDEKDEEDEGEGESESEGEGEDEGEGEGEDEDAVSSSISSSYDLATMQDGNAQGDEMEEEDGDEGGNEDEDEEADEDADEGLDEDDGMEVEPKVTVEAVTDEQLIERFNHVWPRTAELLSIGCINDDADDGEGGEGARPMTASGIVFVSIIKPEVGKGYYNWGDTDYLVQSTDSWYRLRIEKDKLFTTTLLEVIPLLPNGELVKTLAVSFDLHSTRNFSDICMPHAHLATAPRLQFKPHTVKHSWRYSPRTTVSSRAVALSMSGRVYDIGFQDTWNGPEESKPKLIEFGDSLITSMAMAPADSHTHNAKSWTMMFVDTCG